MARINNLTNFLTDVATAIRSKKGSEATIAAEDFDTEILNLPAQGEYQDKSLEITTNGNYRVDPDTGYDAMTSVAIAVDVPSESDIETIYGSLGYITLVSLKLNGNACNGYARSFYPYTIVTFQNTADYFLLDFSGADYELRAFSSTPAPGIDGTIIGVYNNCIYVWTRGTIYVYDITTTELVKSISIPSSRQGPWGFGTSNFGFVGNPTNGSQAFNQFNPIDDSFTTVFSVQIIQSVFASSYYASFANNELGILNRNANDNAGYYATVVFDYKAKKYYTLNRAYFQGISGDLSLCFINGSIYNCSISGSTIAVGSLVKSDAITKKMFVYNVKDNIYVVSNGDGLSGSTGISYIYQLDRTTYTFSLLQTFVNSTKNILCTTNGPIIGYNVDGIPLYLPTDTDAVNSGNVLTGQIVYTAAHQMITGTMPNNGALSYTPSTSQQTIPAGYTSGGTVRAVTSAIDSNIQAGNIKRGVTILGVEGTYDGPGYDPNLVLDSVSGGEEKEQYLGGAPITEITSIAGFDAFNANGDSISYYVMKTVTVTSNMTGFSMNNIKVLENGVIQWLPYGNNTVFDTDDYLECTITCTDAYNNTETDVITIYNSEEPEPEEGEE